MATAATSSRVIWTPVRDVGQSEIIMRAVLIPYLLVGVLVMSGCGPKAIAPSPRAVSKNGCILPDPSTLGTNATNLEVAKVTYQKLAVEGIKVSDNPQVVNLLSTASRDADMRGYLRCEAIAQGYTGDQAAYFEQMNAFIATGASAEQFMAWQSQHPFPAKVDPDAEAKRAAAEQQRIQAEKDKYEACHKAAYAVCSKRDPPIYATPNQQCNDPRTHYMVRRNEKVEMTECYALPVYGDCVGKCILTNAQTLDTICREEANAKCK
jgi:hypothetical protein